VSWPGVKPHVPVPVIGPHRLNDKEPPPPRLRSSKPASDPDQFCEHVGQALQIYLKSKEVPDNADPFYVRAFPKERLTKVDTPFDGITYKILSSVPAQTRNDGTISRKPYSFIEPDPTKHGYELVTDAWFELATVEFTIWSKSNPTRGKLVNWFHKFILRYANAYKYFEARGADKLQFVGRGEDGFETHEEQEVYFGTLTYQVRIQFLDTFSQRQLDSLTIDSQFGHDQQTILQTAHP
jgi:hypothetical protein